MLKHRKQLDLESLMHQKKPDNGHLSFLNNKSAMTLVRGGLTEKEQA